MLKVILVDDETLVKVGIKSLANWEELGFRIVAEGSNGEQGLSLISQHKPDLVITDIVMPKLDGIDMMKKARALNPNITFVVLSSYDEFDLVKRAMKYGAWDYLLKLNICEESLTEMLTNVKEKIMSDRSKHTAAEVVPIQLDVQNTNIIKQEFFKSLIENNFEDRKYIDAKLNIMNLSFDESKLRIGIVKTNLYSTDNKYSEEDVKLVDFMIMEILNEIANEFFNSIFLKWEYGVFVFVFSQDNDIDDANTREQIKIMGNTMLEMLKKYINISAAIGVSGVNNGYLSLPAAFEQAEKALEMLFYRGFGSIIFFDDTYEAVDQKHKPVQINLKEDLTKAIEVIDIPAIDRVFNEIKSYIKSSSATRNEIKEICNQTACLCDILLGEKWNAYKEAQAKNELVTEMVYKMQTLEEIISWLDNYKGKMIAYLNKENYDEKHVLVSRAKKYISENYLGATTLKEVATYLNISAGYLSGIFTKYTGEHFTDYVNKIKIAEAQKMLKDGQYKIYEISYMLGYENSCYFSKVFRKIVGVSPTDFLKMNVK